MVFACKKCKKCFRKDYSGEADEADEFCPHCDNHFVLEAKTPQAALKVESEDVRVDARMLKDDRVGDKDERTIWDGDEERLG
jgi:acetyl-CoA carboxylase beta subunit